MTVEWELSFALEKKFKLNLLQHMPKPDLRSPIGQDWQEMSSSTLILHFKGIITGINISITSFQMQACRTPNK
jgi:hypothetical protein